MSSRNRQRPSHHHNQDADEERRLWKGIRSKSQEVDAMVARSNEIGQQILEAEQAQAALVEADKPTDGALDEKLEKLYRENVKLCEEIMSLVSGNSSDGMNLLDSINILAGLREASEASAAAAAAEFGGIGGLEGRRSAAGGGKLKRVRGVSGSASVKGGSAAASVAGDEASNSGGGGAGGGTSGGGEESAAPSPKVRLGVPKEGRGSSANPSSGSVGPEKITTGGGSGEKNSRSGSVTTNATTTREASVKIEDGAESVASSTDTSSLPIKQEPNGGGSNTSQPPSSASQAHQSSKPSNRIQFKTGEIVFYRHKNNSSHANSVLEGEGILCHVTSVIGEGKQRRYEVQDIDQSDQKSQPMRASVSNLISIPTSNKGLQDLPKGRNVLAQYPDTTTFYKAVVSTAWKAAEMAKGERGEMVRLRFDGEENENVESEVERRLVLLEKER